MASTTLLRRLQPSRKTILAILSVLALLHCRFLLSIFLHDNTTIVTTATFYNEVKRLKLPRFLLCFAKLYTYNRIKPTDIQMLYNRSSTLNTTTSQSYKWTLDIDDVIVDVKFNGKVVNQSELFQRIFYLPFQTCWVTNPATYNHQVGRPGSVNTFDIIINSAVYDDMMIEHNSPLTYLTIVPYITESANRVTSTIPSMSSSVHVSPGRFSAIGFSWTKLDSSYRNKNDERSCFDGEFNKAQCISTLYKNKLHACGLNVQDTNTSVLLHANCGLEPHVKHEPCLFELCKQNVFRFTKSEAYIKYDNRLSVTAIDAQRLGSLKDKIATATRLDSKFNPHMKKSFSAIANNMARLTDNIAVTLGEVKGFKCTSLVNRDIHLKNLDSEDIPNDIAEYEHMTTKRKQFLDRSMKILTRLMKTLPRMRLGVEEIQLATPIILQNGLKNTDSFLTNDHTHHAIETFRTFFYFTFGEIDSLRKEAVTMITNYQNLHFTRFIKKHSSIGLIGRYNSLLKSTIDALQNLKHDLYEGSIQRIKRFSEQDERTKVIHTKHNFLKLPSGTRVTSAYPGNTWLQYAWMLNKGILHSERNRIPFDKTEVYEVIYRGHATVERIPIPLIVDQFCAWYHNYLGTAERFHGSRISFSLHRQHQLKSDIMNEYTIFVLNQIFTTHDTANVFDIENDAIDGAERRSCARLSAYPIYIGTNTTSRESLRMFRNTVDNYFGHDNKGAGKTIQLVQAVVTIFGRISKCELTSAKFHEYYKKQVSGTVGSAMSKVMNLRKIFTRFHKFDVERQEHKRFLIHRLKTLANLIREKLDGDSEDNISHYLSKKGKILVGEIQIEVATINQQLQTADNQYQYYDKIISIMYANTSSLYRAVLSGVMATQFHADFDIRSAIINELSKCNINRWMKTMMDFGPSISAMTTWIKNATVMVSRARRYTKSLEISKMLLRQNFMHVSLYYDSLTVLTKTSAPLVSVKSLVAKLGAVLRIYLRMTLFRMLNLVITCFAAVITFLCLRLF